MDIAQYTTQSLLGPRKAALEPVPPVQRKDSGGSSAQPPADPNGLFGTLVDTVNPLQHIPGVSSVYREVTGDTANPLASMAGGFLFGGPIGLAAGAAGSFLEMLTGKSLLGNVTALFSGEGEGDTGGAGGEPTAVASDASPLLSPTPGISLGQYQAFASTADAMHKGTGASASHVGWAENVWTQQALREATGSYETQQQLSQSGSARTERIV